MKIFKKIMELILREPMALTRPSQCLTVTKQTLGREAKTGSVRRRSQTERND